MEEGILSLPEAPVADPLGAIVSRIRSGEVDAFAELMALTEQRVLGLAWRILGDRDLARDAAQETYLRVFRSLESFRLGERFEAWLIRIAVHVCYDLARKRGPRMLPQEALEVTSLIQETAGAEEAVLQQQRRTLVRQALALLPQGERTALVLRDLEGLSTEEVARILKVKPVTIRSQVASARAKIQVHCERHLNQTTGGQP
jgi:RNA polymerase sigma-70 factor (ECF subfamily)